MPSDSVLERPEAGPVTSSRRDGFSRWIWLVLLLSLVARVPGMFHDFWFDEAWSSLLVRQFVSSPLDILTRLRIDNNHPLNSLFLYALGDRPTWFVYRLPSLVFGVGSVALAGRVMGRRGRPHAVAAMILFACSYPLIVYSSEARGYASMIFFTLLAIDSYERYLNARTRSALVMFWGAAILGWLSHLTFLHAYIAILLWSAYEERKRADRLRHSLARLAACHGVPLVFLGVFDLLYIRHLEVAGAEPASLSSVLNETISVALGTPMRAGWIGSAMFVALLVGGLRMIKRADFGLFVLFAAGILIVPGAAVIIGIRNATVIEPRFFPRYFLVSVTLFLLLMAWVAAEQYPRGGWRRLSVTLLVVFYAIGHSWQVVRFAKDGRGHYREALLDVAGQSRSPEIKVSSNSDFRTSVLLTFYRRYLPAGKTLVFYPQTFALAQETDWRIVEDVVPNDRVPAALDDGRGHRYQLMKRYAFYGLSGCQWSVYARVDRPISAAASRQPQPAN